MITAVQLDPAAGARIEAPLSAAGRVYEDLHRRIVALEIPPDTILSRADLARDYGVSQTPVREAIQRLEQEGLVKTFPQSRTVVTRIDIAAMEEAHFLRLSVETEVVRSLALMRADWVVRDVGAILKLQETVVGDLDQLPLFQALDETFHSTLFAAARRANLHALIKSRTGHMARARRLDLPRVEKMVAIYDAHCLIHEAIARGDPQAAEDAMREHLSGTLSRIETLTRERPDLFPPA